MLKNTSFVRENSETDFSRIVSDIVKSDIYKKNIRKKKKQFCWKCISLISEIKFQSSMITVLNLKDVHLDIFNKSQCWLHVALFPGQNEFKVQIYQEKIKPLSEFLSRKTQKRLDKFNIFNRKKPTGMSKRCTFYKTNSRKMSMIKNCCQMFLRKKIIFLLLSEYFFTSLNIL